jgi:hypothetical protein
MGADVSGDERARELRAPAARVRSQQPRAPLVAGLTAMASLIGNARFARALAPGGGIMPSGAVHPVVEDAIRSRAGRGNRLDSAVAALAGDALGSLDHVRVHHDATADSLSRAVSARAFTVRNDVFFAAGQYRPHAADGRRLIAHELTHVAQQRGAPAGGTLRVTDPGDAYERHADAVADELER